MNEKTTTTNILLTPLVVLGKLLYKGFLGIVYAVCWVYGFLTP